MRSEPVNNSATRVGRNLLKGLLGKRRLGQRGRKGWVDPDNGGELLGHRATVDEAFGVTSEGVPQDGGAGGAVLLGVSQVDLGGGQIPKTTVLVLGVVPGEEGGAIGAGLVAVGEAAGVAGVVFERLE